MKPSFVIFQAECVNQNADSACHLIMLPVVDGIKQEPKEFFFNPEARYVLVCSGISSKDVENFPKFKEIWPEIQKEFSKYPIAVSTADGYSARALHGTLQRLGVDMAPIAYCNAKAICRKTIDSVSYSLDFLSFEKFKDSVDPYDPLAVTDRWCDLVLMGLEHSEEPDLISFLRNNLISQGLLSNDEFVHSLCKRDYSARRANAFKPESVEVNADTNNPFYGMNVVFTGKLENVKRDDARAMVVRVGGMAPERLTTETDYLVVGGQDLRVVGEKGLSGKMKTAAKYKDKGYPIEIIDEADFFQMLSEK